MPGILSLHRPSWWLPSVGRIRRRASCQFLWEDIGRVWRGSQSPKSMPINPQTSQCCIRSPSPLLRFCNHSNGMSSIRNRERFQLSQLWKDRKRSLKPLSRLKLISSIMRLLRIFWLRICFYPSISCKPWALTLRTTLSTLKGFWLL